VGLGCGAQCRAYGLFEHGLAGLGGPICVRQTRAAIDNNHVVPFAGRSGCKRERQLEAPSFAFRGRTATTVGILECI
jgi:hypothetical protein